MRERVRHLDGRQIFTEAEQRHTANPSSLLLQCRLRCEQLHSVVSVHEKCLEKLIDQLGHLNSC